MHIIWFRVIYRKSKVNSTAAPSSWRKWWQGDCLKDTLVDNCDLKGGSMLVLRVSPPPRFLSIGYWKVIP